MKTCQAQIKSSNSDLGTNFEKHIQLINIAASNRADLIVFPELSLTNYETSLAVANAFSPDDPRLSVFQQLSDEKDIVISVGLPLKNPGGITISSIFFQPNTTPLIYSKQWLHPDETRYFIPGDRQVIIKIKGIRLAPAICYESMIPEHIQQCLPLGFDIYCVSVAKHKQGMGKAISHLENVSGKNQLTTFICNAVGNCEDFVANGVSAVVERDGRTICTGPENKESLLFYDFERKKYEITEM